MKRPRTSTGVLNWLRKLMKRISRLPKVIRRPLRILDRTDDDIYGVAA